MQQYTFEYLQVPNKPHRYNKVPLNISGGQMNQAQELPSTDRRKLLPKQINMQLKKDKDKSFYHHSSIYNLKELKGLTKSPVFSNQPDVSISKINEISHRVHITDFKRKVASYLLKKVEASKNYKKFYSETKQGTSLKELESLHQLLQTQQEENLNKSLCGNKYTIKTEYQSDLGVEAYFMDTSNRILGKQTISTERIQQRFLRFMEPFLNDEKVDYDLKMDTMVRQYQEIVRKLKSHAHKIRLPENFVVQMSDYNDFYQVHEKEKQALEQRIDEYADELIVSLSNLSKMTSPAKSSKRPSQMVIEVEDQTLNLKTEPTPRHDQEALKEEKEQRSKRPRQPKSKQQSQQKSIQSRNNIQSQQVVGQPPSNSEQDRPLGQATPAEQEQEHNEPSIDEDEIRREIQQTLKGHKKTLTKEEKEEAKKRKLEMERRRAEIERIKREKDGEFQYQRTDSDSDDKYRRQKNQNNLIEMFGQQKIVSRRRSDQPIAQENTPLELSDNRSEKALEDIQDLDKFLASKQEFEKYQKPYLNVQLKGNTNQGNPIEIWDSSQPQEKRRIPGQTTSTTSQQKQQQAAPHQSIHSSVHSTHQQPGSNQQQNKFPPSQGSSPPKTGQAEYEKYQISGQGNSKDLNSRPDSALSITLKVPSKVMPSPNQSIIQKEQSVRDSKFNSNQGSPKNLTQEQGRSGQQKKLNQSSSNHRSDSQTQSQAKIQASVHSRKNVSQPKITIEDINREINERINKVQQTLEQVKLSIVDQLLDAPSIYDVRIKEYKLAHHDPDDVQFPKMESEEEKSVFKELFAWQKEIVLSVPRLRAVNRNLEVTDETQLFEQKDAPKEDLKNEMQEKSDESDSD